MAEFDPKKTISLMVPKDRMEATVQFYTDGLGLQEEKRRDGIKTYLIAGQQRIKLVALPGRLLETRTSLRFHIHGIEECVRYLISSGHLPRKAATEPGTGKHEMEITDPAGNVITLLDADYFALGSNTSEQPSSP